MYRYYYQEGDKWYYQDFDDRSKYLKAMGFEWLESLLGALEKIVGPILIVVGAVGVIYAIYLGVMLAKAENAEKREESKKRIINVLIAIAITAALIFLMYLFSSHVDWFMGLNQNTEGATEKEKFPSTMIGLLSLWRA